MLLLSTSTFYFVGEFCCCVFIRCKIVKHFELWSVHEEELNKLSSFINSFISAHARWRELKGLGLNGHVALRKPLISEAYQKETPHFARKHKDWTPEWWKKVMWSHESRFTLFQSDGGIGVGSGFGRLNAGVQHSKIFAQNPQNIRVYDSFLARKCIYTQLPAPITNSLKKVNCRLT